MTPYHAKYYAHELCRHGGDGVDRLGRALLDAICFNGCNNFNTWKVWLLEEEAHKAMWDVQDV